MTFLDLYRKPGLIAAHRGARSIAPENTLSALRASVGMCDFIEIDVQLSKDGVLVIMHDETLERTTDVASHPAYSSRKPWRVDAFLLNELERLDYGSWFYETDPFGTLKAGRAPARMHEPLLTLENALRFVVQNDLYINVEIKDMQGHFSDGDVAAGVVAIIESVGAGSRVLLSSFQHAYLPICKAIAPHIPTAALQEGAHPPRLLEKLAELKVDAYHCDDAIVNRQTVERLREKGCFTAVYTVNDPQRREELFSWGVNAVFTDFLL